jgi:class 3 adenylate cyclase
MSNPQLTGSSQNLLIAFCDLTKFTAVVSRLSDQKTYAFLQSLTEEIEPRIEEAGGRVIKYIGDSALMVFPEERAEEGILALLDLKKHIDQHYANQGLPCRLICQIHFGEAYLGPLGLKEPRMDVVGKNVNLTARIQTSSFALSPQAFRQLSPKGRKAFKKHTPPVTYIRIEDRHEGYKGFG